MLNQNGNRELAYLVKIDNIIEIPEADRVETAVVGGWRIMVRKNQFHIGDIAVYFEIDSKVPEVEPFMFLESKHFKVKTQKYFKGKVISQGLLMSLDDFIINGEEPTWVTDTKYRIKEGKNVEHEFLTSLLGVTYAVEEDNKRKAPSVDKYKKMSQRHPQVFRQPWARWMMKREWGRKVMFFFFGKKKDTSNSGWPVGKFPGVSKTDQERCLVGDTKIHTDQGLLRIADIVNKQLQVKVLSYNHEKKVFEYKPINNYQKYKPNILEPKCSIEYSYQPGTSRVKHLVCTPDHKIYTQRGYIQAKDLQLTDSILMLDENSYFGEEILAVVYGMLLGDSHIAQDNRSSGRIRVCTTNGSEQLPYLQYKQSMFAKNDGHIINAGIGSFGVKDKPVYKYFQEVDSWLDQNIKKDWLDNSEKKKHISQNVINKLTEASLAFWYMDDGSLSYREGLKKVHRNPSIRLNTQGFTYEEVELLIDTLINKFDIECNIQNDKGWIIYIHTSSTPKFLKKVTPYMCKSMAYKTLPELEYLLETKTFTFTKGKQLISLPILKLDTTKVDKYIKGSTYDLEVVDNHNFIAQGILTHNCENMPWVLQDKTPFIVTQKCDGSSGTFILEHKKRNKFEFYVCSRNVRMMTPDQKCFYNDNYYWEVAVKYDIKNKMKDYLINHPELTFVCWQGEICAPGIQKNPHKLSETHLFCFHMTDDTGRYDIREAKKIWDSYDMETVPIINDNYIMPDDFEVFKLEADGFYNASVCEGQNNCAREGFVYYKTTEPTFSFKNVSREYLLKHHQ